MWATLGAIGDDVRFLAQTPPVPGIGNAGGFRMMIEDRSGRGSEALLQAVQAMMGRAAQTTGVQQGEARPVMTAAELIQVQQLVRRVA